jgi:hypothetical protein
MFQASSFLDALFRLSMPDATPRCTLPWPTATRRFHNSRAKTTCSSEGLVYINKNPEYHGDKGIGKKVATDGLDGVVMFSAGVPDV